MQIKHLHSSRKNNNHRRLQERIIISSKKVDRNQMRILLKCSKLGVTIL